MQTPSGARLHLCGDTRAVAAARFIKRPTLFRAFIKANPFLLIASRRGIRATKNRALQRAGDTNMRMNAKELIADARVAAPTLPPAAAKLMTAMADRLNVQFVVLCESRNEVKQLAAENAALKAERTQIAEIGELIRTQDNRITDQPFFAVMTKREMISSEDHDYDRICWVENQSGDYVEATETQHRRLEAIYQGRYEVREGWNRFAMKEIDVFVTGCFTEHGCKEYIRQNGHNLNKPFIYAFGSYRNHEYQKVRKFIMGIPQTPATDASLASLRAEARKQGAVFAANRMLAAWDAGFVEDTPENAADIARTILMSTEFMDEAPDGDFDRSFADQVLEAIAAQLRSKSEVPS